MEPIVDIQRLSYAYRGFEDRWVLRDISLQIQPGEFIAVAGRTGSGKSTLCYSMIKGNAWWKYYLTALLWCVIGAFYLCTNFQLLNLLPQEVIWPGVFPAVIVTTFIGGLLGPIVARVIGPAAKRYGLSRDEMGYEKEALVPAPKPAAAVGAQKA